MFERLFPTPYPFARTVIVNTKDGHAFRGVLWERRADFLVLRKAELLKPRSEVVPIDGDVILYRSDVSFIQVLAPSASA